MTVYFGFSRSRIETDRKKIRNPNLNEFKMVYKFNKFCNS